MFTVEIPQGKNVSTLKDEVKKKKAPHLDHVAASDLELWEVSFPIDDLASKQPPALRPSLRPHRLLSDLFTSGLNVSHIHIAARVPGTGMCYIHLYNFFSFPIKVHWLLVPPCSRRLHIQITIGKPTPSSG
jgi:hypothetical protein